MNEICLGRRGCRNAFIYLLTLVMAGCAVGPDYHRPSPGPVPATWKATAPWKVGTPRDAEIKRNFWEVFDDPVLTALEVEATTNNPDVQAAFERVEEARAVARVTRADLFPSVNFEPSADRTRYSQNRTAQPGSGVISYTGNEFIAPVDLSYEIDLWGRVRRSFHEAREQAQASSADYGNILLSLQADVAETYFMIRSVDLDRRVVVQTIDLRQKNLTLVESLHRGGADSAVDLAEAQTELSSAEADLAGLKLQRAQLENTLGTLCGQSASSFSLAETERFYEPPAVPVDLPADLLERRPDVAEAERQMAAANEGIGIAKAAFFPSITLTGYAGVESVNLKNIFDWEGSIWSIGPNVNLPIFEGGRNKAGLQQAKASYAESVATYRSHVLTAFHEVEDGLIGLQLLKQQYDAQMDAVDSAKKVADLSRLRYKEGLASYFEVVIADRTMLENEITAYELNGQNLVTTVRLIKALGGGWAQRNPMMTNGVAPLQKIN
ncbi:MAG TPA: efflux transporter outer membrane subunit [Verrucomicrobiae bacterium]|jgi:multidrug efflux system outer membrane protein